MEYVHGVGTRLADLMEREHGAALNVLKAIKATLDPDHVLNPGKLNL
jgi:FAD/FMN-containing dehydrogenase